MIEKPEADHMTLITLKILKDQIVLVESDFKVPNLPLLEFVAIQKKNWFFK
jgi:hypothetical protein